MILDIRNPGDRVHIKGHVAAYVVLEASARVGREGVEKKYLLQATTEPDPKKKGGQWFDHGDVFG